MLLSGDPKELRATATVLLSLLAKHGGRVVMADGEGDSLYMKAFLQEMLGDKRGALATYKQANQKETSLVMDELIRFAIADLISENPARRVEAKNMFANLADATHPGFPLWSETLTRAGLPPNYLPRVPTETFSFPASEVPIWEKLLHHLDEAQSSRLALNLLRESSVTQNPYIRKAAEDAQRGTSRSLDEFCAVRNELARTYAETFIARRLRAYCLDEKNISRSTHRIPECLEVATTVCAPK